MSEGGASKSRLNRAYGKAGMTFKNMVDAMEYAKGFGNRARIYPLWDYFAGCRQRIGYLVSVDPPPPKRPRFTGKVRSPN